MYFFLTILQSFPKTSEFRQYSKKREREAMVPDQDKLIPYYCSYKLIGVVLGVICPDY